MLSLFRLAKQIKLRLGKQSYLLDNYLSFIFEGVNYRLAFNVAEEGLQTGSDFQSLLSHVLDGSEPKKPHPLYQRVKEVYEQNTDKLIYQEHYTNLSMLLFLLVDEAMEYFTTTFIAEQVSGLNGAMDYIRHQELYDQISHIAGEAMMEEFNLRLKQRFLVAPAAITFAQGFTESLIFNLNARDHETSKQMFQLLLDSMPDDMEV